jgi:2-keto-4-pentenoate hydratase/2-oxohepta-3-ene-1,7-dioic acid hydratase in catechol pathway
MRLVSFHDAAGGSRVGVVRDALVAPIDVARSAGRSAMRTLLGQGEDGLARASAQAEAAFAGARGLRNLPELSLCPPVPDPEKILCVGFNYRDHTEEMAMEQQAAPNVFAKFRNSLIGSDDDVVLSGPSTEIDYEGELAAVIGRRCRAVGVEDALEFVAGYTVHNDVTARDLQFKTSQWTLGKAIDTFGPMGPVLTLIDEIPDPQAVSITTRLNGEVMQHAATSEMVFTLAELIAVISQSMTLEPGDVISTGTPAGVGYKRTPPRFLTDGDLIEVEITNIGVLRNRVRAPISTAAARSPL